MLFSVQLLSVSQEADEVSGHGWVLVWSGTCRLQDLIHVRCWSSLPSGDLPADWLVKLSKWGKGPGILPQGLKSRAWTDSLARDLAIHLLVLSVQLQSLCQSYSEVMGNGGVYNMPFLRTNDTSLTSPTLMHLQLSLSKLAPFQQL